MNTDERRARIRDVERIISGNGKDCTYGAGYVARHCGLDHRMVMKRYGEVLSASTFLKLARRKG